MAQRLLGLSGTKQSGKTTCMNFLYGTIMQKNGVISQDPHKNRFGISKQGKLLVPVDYTDSLGSEKSGMGEFDWDSPSYENQQYCENLIFPYVQEFSFAKPLKDMCIDLLGLTYEQCYGTDEQKNSLTNLLWEDMPGFIKIVLDDEGFAVLEPIRKGLMTAREVLQYVGTDIFRKIYEKVWTANGIKRFIASATGFGAFSDVRFPNELDVIHDEGGKVVRFLRRPKIDLHKSEIAMDELPDDAYDAVLDNRDMSIPEQNEAVHQILLGWGWI